jgi:hypothetical protein
MGKLNLEQMIHGCKLGGHCFFWLSHNGASGGDLPVAKSKYRIYFNDLDKLFNDTKSRIIFKLKGLSYG